MAPSAEAVAALDGFLEALPDEPDGARGRDRNARRFGVAGDDGDRGAALLRLRDRRVAAGGAWGRTGWRARGIRTADCSSPRRSRRCSKRCRCAGWLDVLGLPAGCGGAFVTGATVANFTALAAARHAVLARAGWDVEAKGLFGAPEIQVVIGDEGHPSMIKSLGMLGLGRERVVRVPVDGQGRMRAGCLPHVERAGHRVRPGGQRQYGRVRPDAGDYRPGARHGRVGARGWRVRPVGGGESAVRASGGGRGRRRFLGDGRAQVAERAVRQRPRLRARSGRSARRDGLDGGLPAAGRSSRAFAVCAGALAAGARRGCVGRAEIARA